MGRASTILAIISIAILYTTVHIYGGYSIVETVYRVYPDGSVEILYTVYVDEPPIEVELEIPYQPIYIDVYTDDTRVPYSYSDGVLQFLAVTENVTVSMYTLEATSKEGFIWRLMVESKSKTYVILPPGSIVLNITGGMYNPTIYLGSPAIEFEPGIYILEYTFPPMEITPLEGGKPDIMSYLLYGVAASSIALAIYLLKRFRGYRRLEGDLDDRDHTILDILKSGEYSAQELMEMTGIPKTPLYRRLKRLEEAGYIESFRRGGRRIYRAKR